MSCDVKIVQHFITAGHFVQTDSVKVAKCVGKQYLNIAISTSNNNMSSFAVDMIDAGHITFSHQYYIMIRLTYRWQHYWFVVPLSYICIYFVQYPCSTCSVYST